jgi:5-methylcytosine-specific restriction endonuclease McrA
MDVLFGGPVAANDNCKKPTKKRDLIAENAKRHVNAPERECEHCGAIFKRRVNSKDAARFCSRQCGYDAGANVVKDPDICQSLVEQSMHLYSSFKVAVIRCIECGHRVTGVSLLQRYCSQDCRRAKYISDNDNGDHLPRHCAECGVSFVTSYGDKRNVYCSNGCSRRNARRIARKKERARLRTLSVESVNPIKVFDRDGWKCMICGVKTPRKLRGTYEDGAPELDHIMPLSLGGAHSYMNTQCACRRCNAEKSNTPPHQPSLFAYVA